MKSLGELKKKFNHEEMFEVARCLSPQGSDVLDSVPRLIAALEKCMEQRNFYIKRMTGGYDITEFTKIKNTELEQILEGK